MYKRLTEEEEKENRKTKRAFDKFIKQSKEILDSDKSTDEEKDNVYDDLEKVVLYFTKMKNIKEREEQIRTRKEKIKKLNNL